MRGPPPRHLVFPLALLAALAAVPPARADSAPPPVVTLDLGARVARTAKAEAPIGLPPEEMPAPADVLKEPLVLDDGRPALHVRAPSTKRAGVAWEAIVLGDAFAYAGVTGYARGEEGERTGEALQIVGGSQRARVLVGELHEDLRLCGQVETPIAARVLDPRSGTFRGASVQRVGEAQRAGAEKLAVRAHPAGSGPDAFAEAPLARLLEVTGASSAASPATGPRALVDLDPATAWVEGRPGAGRGEFVVLRAPGAVPLSRLTVTFSPTASGLPRVTPPRVFYLLTDARTFEVTLPEGALAARSYDLAFAEPVRTSCLALVLESADSADRSAAASLDVGVAELTAYSAFDGPRATLAEVASALRGGGPRAEAAAAVLERAGGPALAEVVKVFPALDDAGRALAIDVAASAATCDESVPLLLAGSGSKGVEVARKAREKLERCGKSAVPKLTATLGSSDLAARGVAAAFLADLAPEASLVPLARALASAGDESAEATASRARVRAALGKAALHAEPFALTPLLSDLEKPLGDASSEAARVDLLRALTPALAEASEPLQRAMLSLLREGAPFRTRYLLAEPLAVLAGADAAARTRFVSLLGHDEDLRVRARLAEVTGPSAVLPPDLQAALIEATRDAAPRVREAAVHALGRTPSEAAQGAVAAALGHDSWTFVRIAAAASLGASAPSSVADVALDRALEDASPRLREAAALALAARGAHGSEAHLSRHLGDDGEVPFVRAAAARALGELCARSATAALTTLASTLAEPRTETDFDVGLSALEALGHLHPEDLAKRLAPLETAGVREEVRRAAQLAKSASRTCPR